MINYGGCSNSSNKGNDNGIIYGECNNSNVSNNNKSSNNGIVVGVIIARMMIMVVVMVIVAIGMTRVVVLKQ